MFPGSGQQKWWYVLPCMQWALRARCPGQQDLHTPPETCMLVTADHLLLSRKGV